MGVAEPDPSLSVGAHGSWSEDESGSEGDGYHSDEDEGNSDE
jgi:hypothetical protein